MKGQGKLHSVEDSDDNLSPVPEPNGQSGEGIQQVDTSYLESLMGYNARRASIRIVAKFMRRMSIYQLRPVDFSVLSLIIHNDGITSRQLCASLGLQPPNLVAMITALEKRELIERRPHPKDGRALGLHASTHGHKLMVEAEQTAAQLEREATSKLSAAECRTLIHLLKKIYL